MKYSCLIKSTTSSINTIEIGGASCIKIQAMTNTDTSDYISTAMQIKELAQAGAELVRITVNNSQAAIAVAKINDQLDKMNVHIPLIGDFHYNGHTLLSEHPECAKALAKYRINPGNVGYGAKKDLQFSQMIEIACKYDKPIRIGVNWGSLDQQLLANLMDKNLAQVVPLSNQKVMQQALIKSALQSAKFAEHIGLAAHNIILSCKVSEVLPLVSVYQELDKICNYPLHLGLTEAGMGIKGITSSSIALGILLNQGIGNTIRVSLTPEPNQSRTQEVMVAQEILQSLGIRHFVPSVTACPGCGRTTSTYFQTLALNIQTFLRSSMPIWKEQYSGVENLKVAVMGCIVNGPGESKHANIGISLPGTGESPSAPVFINGQKHTTLRGGDIDKQFEVIIQQYIKNTYKAAH